MCRSVDTFESSDGDHPTQSSTASSLSAPASPVARSRTLSGSNMEGSRLESLCNCFGTICRCQASIHLQLGMAVCDVPVPFPDSTSSTWICRSPQQEVDDTNSLCPARYGYLRACRPWLCHCAVMHDVDSLPLLLCQSRSPFRVEKHRRESTRTIQHSRASHAWPSPNLGLPCLSASQQSRCFLDRGQSR